jgi:hypothetical protein
LLIEINLLRHHLLLTEGLILLVEASNIVLIEISWHILERNLVHKWWYVHVRTTKSRLHHILAKLHLRLETLPTHTRSWKSIVLWWKLVKSIHLLRHVKLSRHLLHLLLLRWWELTHHLLLIVHVLLLLLWWRVLAWACKWVHRRGRWWILSRAGESIHRGLGWWKLTHLVYIFLRRLLLDQFFW